MMLPTVVLATDLAPAFNPLCWKLKDCADVRGEMNNSTDKTVNESGWISEDDCTGDWGKCLPTGQITTTIAFGGKTSFTNIGEFIKYNYGLALSIAGILAVIIIIVAGVQWVISGGNSEMIGSAKKRIGGAVIGLLIAYLSYTILNTINPATVNLHLPQVWLLRKTVLATEFCKDLPVGTKFAFAADPGADVDKANFASINFDDKSLVYNLGSSNNSADFKCGRQLFFKGGAGQTCKGHACMQLTTCDLYSKTPTCKAGFLSGSIGGSGFAFCGSQVTGDGDNVKLMMMCKNGKVVQINDRDNFDKGKQFAFSDNSGSLFNTAGEQAVVLCGGNKAGKFSDAVAGFYIGLEINDEAGLGVFADCINAGVGDDDWYAVGKSSPGQCDVNLVRLGFGSDAPKMCSEYGKIACACSQLSYLPFGAYVVKDPEFVKHLISWDELFSNEGGYVCNISILKKDFPDVNNSVFNVPMGTGEWTDLIPTTAVYNVFKWASTVIDKAIFDGDPTNCNRFIGNYPD